MEITTVKTKRGTTRHVPRVTAEELSEGTLGFCVGCGAEAGPVEPDAREYTCETCGQKLVYGLEELLLMGMLQLSDEEE